MGNTLNIALPLLSQKVYKEWYAKTVLVQSCDNSYENEFDLDKRELDIPVYHDLSIHKTTIKENELKPAAVELIKFSTKRVVIDKGRYSHWGESNLGKLIERLSEQNSETRKKLVNKWAVEAEKELAVYCAQLPAAQTIDLISIFTTAGIVDKDNLLRALDILKAHVISKNMEPTDFTLFASEKFETVLRETKLPLSSLDANEAFRTGSVGMVNGVDVRKIQVSAITTRDATTKEVTAEWGIFKTRDGIQYVVPYKDTVQYDISPSEILKGGKGYQMLEYYDFFNLYPARLYKVKIRYSGTANPPTSF